MPIDPFGRIIDYLRISVTDRCNFRCLYCYAPSGEEPTPPFRLLGTEEFVRVARVAAGLGVRKFKLTGGEPLLFHGIVPLVERLAALPGVEDLSITTNGSLLRKLAAPLHHAGLRRINLSLDSLRPDRFARISRGGDLAETLAAFETARRAGLSVKINTVALEGWNADELPAFVRFAGERDVEVRFIEFMPLGGHGWVPDLFLSARAMRNRLQRRYTLRPLESSGVAERYVTDTGARIGFIPTMSEPFCEGCRRLRLTAWGSLLPCLFSRREIPLAPLLAADIGEEALRSAFLRAVEAKPERNAVLAGVEDPRALRIRSIGG
jgi:cyclic pyranopterin phosphate synthase